MKTIIHKAGTRGHAGYGWLNTHYTFSFANYYDPERMHFGTLRVLNDDEIAGGQGFGRHPHDNMEIITIPLEGELEHKDSMGNTFLIRRNEVQTMSAGTGIFHSEYNKLPDQMLRLLQIWVFPERKNLQPSYDQKAFDPAGRKNKWQRIVSPDEPEAVKIVQDAYFSMAALEKDRSLEYSLRNPGHGVYLFIIEGSIQTGDTQLGRRDGMGLWETDSVALTATEDAEILLMEIPMEE